MKKYKCLSMFEICISRFEYYIKTAWNYRK